MAEQLRWGTLGSSYSEGGTMLGAPKSASSIRDIAIPPPLVPMLSAHRTSQMRDRLAAGDAWRETIPDLVFTSKIGTPLCCSEVSREFKKQLVELGLAPRRFHDLRHTAGTMMLAKGVDISVISKVLGHSSIAITSSIYAHATPAVRRDAAERMGHLLNDAELQEEDRETTLGRDWAAS